MHFISGRWWRGKQIIGWRRRWKVATVRRWGREITTRLLCLAHFGLKSQRQVGQVELAWFRRSRGSSRELLGRRSRGGGSRACG